MTGSDTPEPDDRRRLMRQKKEDMHRGESTPQEARRLDSGDRPQDLKDNNVFPGSEDPETDTTRREGNLFALTVLDSEAMHNRIGKALWAQAVENKGLMHAPKPDHFIRIVGDVAIAIKYYLEDTR